MFSPTTAGHAQPSPSFTGINATSTSHHLVKFLRARRCHRRPVLWPPFTTTATVSPAGTQPLCSPSSTCRHCKHPVQKSQQPPSPALPVVSTSRSYVSMANVAVMNACAGGGCCEARSPLLMLGLVGLFGKFAAERVMVADVLDGMVLARVHCETRLRQVRRSCSLLSCDWCVGAARLQPHDSELTSPSHNSPNSPPWRRKELQSPSWLTRHSTLSSIPTPRAVVPACGRRRSAALYPCCQWDTFRSSSLCKKKGT